VVDGCHIPAFCQRKACIEQWIFIPYPCLGSYLATNDTLNHAAPTNYGPMDIRVVFVSPSFRSGSISNQCISLHRLEISRCEPLTRDGSWGYASSNSGECDIHSRPATIFVLPSAWRFCARDWTRTGTSRPYSELISLEHAPLVQHSAIVRDSNMVNI
jgi:hypothetical protein